MYTVHARNVNDALEKGIQYLNQRGKVNESRNGPVVTVEGPVATVYSHPCERVLFSPVRRANPFFHLFESIWMLAGRNDVKFPATFAGNIKNYSDDGVTLNGAYGYAWRYKFGVDQVEIAIDKLRTNPRDRRVVIQHWSIEDLKGDKKDHPCNTHIYLSIWEDRLNMTVCNRSNDIIWGAYGANAVHFSILHEYIASSIGVKIGTYVQMSNNYHAYIENPLWEKLVGTSAHQYYPLPTLPLFGENSKEEFDEDVQYFMSIFDGEDHWERRERKIAKTEFFNSCVIPMYDAWKIWKNKERCLKDSTFRNIEAVDWRIAAIQFINKVES